MSMLCGIFVQFFKCKILMSDKFVSFIASLYIVYSTRGRGDTKRRLSNNREDDDGFEYLKNLLTLVVTVASWILYVANERKINSPFGNFLTKIIIFCFK
jgi:hypothetical protein